MGWADIDDDTLVLSIRCAHSDRIQAVRAVGFDDEEGLLEYGDPRATSVELLEACGAWTDGALRVEKQHFGGLNVARKPWVQIELDYGPAQGSLYAKLEWEDEDPADGFCLVLASHGVSGPEAVVVAPGACPEGITPLSLEVERDPPQAVERVYVAGDGGATKQFRYDYQVRNYLILQEFAEQLAYAGDDYEIPDDGNPQTTQYDDDTMVTLINSYVDRSDEGICQHRVTYQRLFPPGCAGAVAPENLCARGRLWVQWYPVYRVDYTRDPITGTGTRLRGGPRLYKYLEWVGENAPGRVSECAFVGHAVVRTPSHLTGGRTGVHHMEGDEAKTGILPAFARNATFMVTGCNADSRIPPSGAGENLVERQALANLEGTIRARIRLGAGAARIQEALEAGDVARARQRASLLLVEVEGEHQAWRIPGEDEDDLRDQDCTYRERDGELIARALYRPLVNLERWTNRDGEPTEEENQVAREALVAIREGLSWDQLKLLQVGGGGQRKTIEEWVANAKRCLSAGTHFVATFAHMARSNGRADIRAVGGNPGQDGQHLNVTVTLDDGLGNTFERELPGWITAYTRNPSWSRYNRPWMLAFYRRLGKHVAGGLGYFRYDVGNHDAEGNYQGLPGHQETDGIDIVTLHPPYVPPSSGGNGASAPAAAPPSSAPAEEPESSTATCVEWECWLRKGSAASRAKVYNGGVIGVFPSHDAAVNEMDPARREANHRAWARNEDWESWLVNPSQALRVKVTRGGVIGVYRTEAQANAEKTADRPWRKER